jgi:N-acetylglutamate synthase-like GNAT family acetyltransferase
MRTMALEDIPQTTSLIHWTLLTVNSMDYPENIIKFLIEEYSTENFTKTFEKSKCQFIAEINNEIVGVGGWSIDTEDPLTAYVSNVFVRPDWIGKGIGKYIMDSIETDIKRADLETIRLNSSISAIEFYTALQYSLVTGQVNENALETKVMTKKLINHQNNKYHHIAMPGIRP